MPRLYEISCFRRLDGEIKLVNTERVLGQDAAMRLYSALADEVPGITVHAHVAGSKPILLAWAGDVPQDAQKPKLEGRSINGGNPG